MKRWMLMGVLALLPATAMAAADATTEGDAAPDLAAIDYALPPVDDGDASDAAWRLPEASWHEEDQGNLRVRVKLRPNKAMGRLSLSF